MSEKSKEQQLADIVAAVKELDLRGADSQNNAIMAFFLVSNRVSTIIDGDSNKIANMILEAARNYPVFASIIKAIAAEL